MAVDKAVLQEQLTAAAEAIAELPRHPRGYHGLVTVEDVIVVVAYRGEDGRIYYADPAEISDGKPDLFLRQYVTIGTRSAPGVSVVALLERFLPYVSPRAAGFFSAIKGLFKS